MANLRTPFQGVWNIIRFNWHFYIMAIIAVFFIFWVTNKVNKPFKFYLKLIGFLILLSTSISLLVSFYVYDLSKLYEFKWLDEMLGNKASKIVNINAGFDETSVLLESKFKHAELVVLDFYDPSKHTEISIKRARKAYPPFPNTLEVATSNLIVKDGVADWVFAILTAHEIRNPKERIIFCKELRRILKSDGNIVIVEHLRDIQNFLAFNIGFFHFFSRKTWLKTFKNADLHVEKLISITPFIKLFILKKYGTAS